MIFKVYPSDCEVWRDKQWPVIIITYDKYIFLSNNGFYFGLQKDENIILSPKSKSWGIMVSEFLFLFG